LNSLFNLAAFLDLAWRPSSDGPGLADGTNRLGACTAGDRIESPTPPPDPPSAGPRRSTGQRSGSVTLVPTAMLIYIGIVFYAFTR
jgi:hypothetical protein